MKPEAKIFIAVLALLVYTGAIVGATIFVGITGELVGTGRARFPSFAKNLPRDVLAAERAFSQDLQDHFPKGSSEESLILYLKREGFMPSWDTPRRALYSKSIFPCVHKWSVIWQVAPRVEALAPVPLQSVTGQYNTFCL